jgi:hypothetical protein
MSSVPRSTPDTTIKTSNRLVLAGRGRTRWRAAGTRREGAGIRGTVTNRARGFNRRGDLACDTEKLCSARLSVLIS